MPHKVWTQSYGKSRVRIAKVFRDTPVHEICELSVEFESSSATVFNRAVSR